MPGTPTLASIFERILEAYSHRIRVALPGRVVTFDAATRTVSVRLELLPRALDENLLPVIDRAVPETLAGVPVVVPSSPRAETSLRLQEGDPGEILFNDYAIGAWVDACDRVPPTVSAVHDFAGPVFYPGLFDRGVPAAIPANVEMRVGLVGGTAIEVHDDGVIRIQEPGGSPEALATQADLLALRNYVDDRYNAITGHVHGGVSAGVATSGPPVGAPAPPTPTGTTKLESE